ncbi:hypothetical protein ACFSO7_15275 [Bacillus sp. CGMCC 1.16607]|uniref:hypothetical protein n=1 Tax=Bacillus sp. CGMCC 1.16607 TaxID=3351842 RepID=UPI0036310225
MKVRLSIVLSIILSFVLISGSIEVKTLPLKPRIIEEIIIHSDKQNKPDIVVLPSIKVKHKTNQQMKPSEVEKEIIEADNQQLIDYKERPVDTSSNEEELENEITKVEELEKEVNELLEEVDELDENIQELEAIINELDEMERIEEELKVLESIREE